MIIASDLDRTIMYSIRALEEFGRPDQIKLIPVEKVNGKWAGYMTESAFSLLQEINSQSLFIPVTTRTTEQFKRFVIFDKEIPLTYAITTNGANILYKGKLLQEWTDQINLILKNETAHQDELQIALKKEGLQFDGQQKQAEGLFFYYLLNSFPANSDLEKIRELTDQYGWRISLQGRKLYFIPTAISKGKALDFICNREGMEAVAGAGDSILDWDFLKNCRYRYIPSHGELLNHLTEDVMLTDTLGVAAGEEILQYFQNALKLKR